MGTRDSATAMAVVKDSLGADFAKPNGGGVGGGSDDDDAGDDDAGAADTGDDGEDGEGGEHDFDDLSGAEDDDGDAADDADATRDQDRRRPKDDLRRRSEQRTEQRTEQRDGRAKPFEYRPVKRDAKGNLVDSTGQIVARAGREARVYQNAFRNAQAASRQETQRAQRETTQLRDNLERAIEIGTKAYNQLEALQKQGNLAKEAGLSGEEHAEAVRLASLSKRDPGAFVRHVLTQAAARGIDLKALGLQGGALDTAAIRQLVDDAVKPLSDAARQEQARREQEAANSERVETLRREVEDWFGANPEAEAYGEVILEAMKRRPNSTLNEVWANIQLYEMRTGQSLVDRGEHRRDGRNGNGRDVRTEQRREPMPRGRMPVNDRGGTDDARAPAPVSASYDDIIKDVMAATTTRRRA